MLYIFTCFSVINLQSSPTDSSCDSCEIRPEWTTWQCQESLMSTLGLFFTLERWQAQGTLLVCCCASLGERQSGQCVACSSYSSNANLLNTCGPGILQLHPQHLRFPQQCLIYGELLVGLLVKGNEIENSPCPWIPDITSLNNNFQLSVPQDRGAWQATVHVVTKESDTTQQLSNSNTSGKCRT